MKTKLILFEGIPGSGKSTLARKSTLFLQKEKGETFLYAEGCLHPANLDGYAAIPVNELGALISKFPQYADKIRSHMIPAGEHLLIQLQKDYRAESVIMQHLQPNAVWWNAGFDFALFMRYQQERWAGFAKRYSESNVTSVFECAFLQDHVTALMLFYEKSGKDIIGYFKSLEEGMLALNPFLFYLQQSDVSETIRRITEQRIKESGGRPWGERVAEMVSTSPYGITHGLTGYSGMVEFFKRRKEMDLLVLRSLKIKHVLINNDNYEWKTVQKEVLEIIKGLVTE